MVFSSVPIYLDPPNWQQHNHHQHGGVGTGSTENPQLPPLPPPSHVGVGGAGSIRPGSMADRASLSQPRHFCKTCRRYWTRGGALRSVPVGGGCRRNKKNKSSSSKSTGSAQKQGGSNSTNAVNNNIPSEITGHLPQQTPHLPFMASLQSFSQFGMGNIGLNFGGSVNGGQAEMGFHIGTNSGMSSPILSSAGHQQFPFFEPTNGLYSLQSEGMEGSSSMMGESQLLRSITSSSRVSQLAPVKMENNNNQGLNLSRSMMNNASENNQYWGGNNWTDLSGLNASNTNHLL
ncbi:hypothetical protein V6Z11_A08G005600 [Gossypium hirsutum]|uniref:Dof zinc finger protein n=1 Tax=Gossypium tomentosum TaxID=34277 RepID=A0A5D2PBF7_GOSTO|nr:hypothetical protein ES332_A08G004600v1 [Gossypium tomentosum]